MKPYLYLAALTLALVASPVSAAGLQGKYIESRTCDIWTGPCFANAEMNLTGKHAVLGWTIDKGEFDGVSLDGLGVVAIVGASDTLGCEQTGKAKAVLIFDERANEKQKAALTKLAKKYGGDLVANVVHTESAKVKLDFCPCDENACATLEAGNAKIESRCLNAKHDKICGNESAFYPPLVKGVKVRPAMAVTSSYKGKGVGAKWEEANRRGVYLGTFGE